MRHTEGMKPLVVGPQKVFLYIDFFLPAFSVNQKVRNVSSLKAATKEDNRVSEQRLERFHCLSLSLAATQEECFKSMKHRARV